MYEFFIIIYIYIYMYKLVFKVIGVTLSALQILFENRVVELFPNVENAILKVNRVSLFIIHIITTVNIQILIN